MVQLRYELAPSVEIGESFKRYIEQDIPCGDFLNAVLSNDLKEACGRADHINRHKLFDIVAWLYNEAPSTCWGSPEKVDAWLARKDNGRNIREIVSQRDALLTALKQVLYLLPDYPPHNPNRHIVDTARKAMHKTEGNA